MLVVITYGNATTEETVDVARVPTMAQLYQQIEAAASRRLHSSVTAQLSRPDGASLPADETAPQHLQIPSIRCHLHARAQLNRCYPLSGPSGGGTRVAIHGTGFSSVGNSARVRFGSAVVPVAEVESDTLLYCMAPEHPTGLVRVQLLRCEDERTSDDEPDSASFEFTRLEAAYDAIFATTNAFCPVRSLECRDRNSPHPAPKEE
jgi:hypothetical protein